MTCSATTPRCSASCSTRTSKCSITIDDASAAHRCRAARRDEPAGRDRAAGGARRARRGHAEGPGRRGRRPAMLVGQRDANERSGAQPRDRPVREAGPQRARQPRPRAVRRRDRQRGERPARDRASNAMLASTPKSRRRADASCAGRRSPRSSTTARRLLRNDATTKQRNYLFVAVGAVALALLVLALANRWITRPLSRLADEARVMASERLPNAVNSILETPPGEDVVPPEVEPVRVRGGAEVAGAVDALNAVQESAMGLAVEQVVLRRNIADSFVNLGRRNQNLLSRQLDLITQLEQEESDAEELEQLFRLDHLATRMRRNAESLLVLAGEEPARQWSAPVPVGDVLAGRARRSRAVLACPPAADGRDDGDRQGRRRRQSHRRGTGRERSHVLAARFDGERLRTPQRRGLRDRDRRRRPRNVGRGHRASERPPLGERNPSRLHRRGTWVTTSSRSSRCGTRSRSTSNRRSPAV